VYLLDLSPHWTQKHVIQRYYEVREGPEEVVLAFQMNWKGENFYTGNRVQVFVDLDTTALREWAAERRGQTVYALTERSRLGGLRSALAPVEIEEITGDEMNNKFMLVRADLQ
jgi:hypothetical protein